MKEYKMSIPASLAGTTLACILVTATLPSNHTLTVATVLLASSLPFQIASWFCIAFDHTLAESKNSERRFMTLLMIGITLGISGVWSIILYKSEFAAIAFFIAGLVVAFVMPPFKDKESGAEGYDSPPID